MEQILQLFILLPLAGFVVSLFAPKKVESIISRIAISTIALHLFGVLAFFVCWILNGAATLDLKHATLYRTAEVDIFIDFFFDKITAAYSIVGSLLTLLVAVFSRTYMHREEGFKRYFSTLLFFFLGYNIVIFSGNFETLFVGWEIVGITSFLLIAFYRDRYLPVKNALKVVSVYRLGDICLILAMWMSHHLWHENITFVKLNDAVLMAQHLEHYYPYAIFVAVMIVIGSAAKSAQFPFSSWLPRAMEGPTTSSAIFYGSLTVHLGLFVLLRTFPYWGNMPEIKYLIIVIGLSTAFIGSMIARMQSTVKTQIAYASAAQIGLMFIEVALGFHTLALFHFAGNAFFRTYQLLVSPSVLSYLIHDMVFNFKPASGNPSSSKLMNSIYMLSLKEWNLDFILFRFLWTPFKWLGSKLQLLSSKISILILSVAFVSGVVYLLLVENVSPILPVVFVLIGFALVLKAFAYRGDALNAWLALVSSHLFLALSIALLSKNFEPEQITVYLSGVVFAAVLGFVSLRNVRTIDNNIDLNQHHGYTYEQPKLGFLFLVSCLALVGLPFTPTFLGIDVMFSHIQKHDALMIILTALSFVFLEIAALRIYARIFMGQHKKNFHPIAFKSS